MASFGTCNDGIVRRNGGNIDILDIACSDLGAALEAGMGASDLATAPVRNSVPSDRVRLQAPVPRPHALWIAGANYRAHNKEIGIKEDPEYPPIMIIGGASITGPFDPVVIPKIAPDQVDYECEIAIVIGGAAKHVACENAWEYVLGLTGAQDISARDVQLGKYLNGHDAAKGKSFDTFTPMGPWVVTPDEFENPDDIGLKTIVDGDVRQDARTSDMIFGVSEIVSFLSDFTTLRPGDVILTGTPGGVALSTGKYLKAGETVRTEIETIGVMEHRLVPED